MWKQFVSMDSSDIFSNRVQNVLDFLSKLFSCGHSYSQINTASSALSSIITINKVPCGKHPDVKRFMKGIFEFGPIFSKYHMIWDIKKVFNYFRNLPVMGNSPLKELFLKLAMLQCLVLGGQQMLTIHLLNLKDIKYVEEQVFIPIMQKIKQSKPGNHIYPLNFKTYPKDTKLCAVAHLNSHKT